MCSALNRQKEASMSPNAVNRRAVDTWEFMRFIGTGVTATVGNLATVWVVGQRGSFGLALIAGSTTGFALSFVLSKLIAFKARSWDRAWVEALRFTLVHVAGAAVYWIVGFAVGRYILSGLLERQLAEVGGAFVGASFMTLTSYFGHRFFTYRTFRLDRNR
jgi:putative flippase GtrA